MLNNLSEETYEWYRQALHCERQADAQTDPKVKQQFLESSGSGSYWRTVTGTALRHF